MADANMKKQLKDKQDRLLAELAAVEERLSKLEVADGKKDNNTCDGCGKKIDGRTKNPVILPTGQKMHAGCAEARDKVVKKK